MIGSIGATDSFVLDVPITDNGTPLNLTGATITARAEGPNGAIVTPATSVPVAGTVRISTAAGALAEGVWRIVLTVALAGGAGVQTVLDGELSVTASPRTAWLTADEVKKHLYAETDEHDAWILRAIEAAAGSLESGWGIVVSAGQRTLTFPGFRGQMALRLTPIRSVTAVRYTDMNDAEQTVPGTDWRLGVPYKQATLMPRLNRPWPIAATYADAVRVEVAAGPATRDDLPEEIRQAALMLIQHWFDNRGVVLIGSISKELEYSLTYLLTPYRQGWLA